MRPAESANADQDGGIAAIVLAAGMSRRMGRFKPLLPFRDRPMVARVVEAIAGGGIESIIVVTGHEAERVREAVSRDTGVSPVLAISSTGETPVSRGTVSEVSFIHNFDYERGEMISSVKAGVAALPPGKGAFVLALGDQPAVQPATIRSLVASWHETRTPLVVPTYDGRRGHPILFSAGCIPDVLNLSPDQTLKTIVERYADQTVQISVDDPAILLDVDTPEEYEQALRLWEPRPRHLVTEGGAYGGK